MSSNVARREYNGIKKAIEDRDRYEGKQADKKWAIAKKTALNEKRSKLRLEAKEKALAEKKKRNEEAKAKKAAHEAAVAKAKQKELDRAAAAEKQKQSEEAATAAEDQDKAPESAVEVVQELDESSDDEIMPSSPSKSRSGPAPAETRAEKRRRQSRALLPDNAIESRFGVILTEVKELWTELNSIRQDIEREERVSVIIYEKFKSFA